MKKKTMVIFLTGRLLVCCWSSNLLGAPNELPSLLAPGIVTNLYFHSQEIKKESQWGLQQDQIWLLGDKIHLLQEKFPAVDSKISLKDFPESVWTNGERFWEFLKTPEGLFSRRWRSPNWEAVRSHLQKLEEEEQKPTPGKYVFPYSGIPARNEWSWLDRPMGDGQYPEVAICSNLFAQYCFMVDSNAGIKVVSSTPERVIVEATTTQDLRRLITRIEFQPTTRLKLAEKRWLDDQLVYRAEWRYQERIDTNIFAMKSEDTPDRYKYRPRLVHHRTTGFGFHLKMSNGPFQIAEIHSNSPMSKLPIKVGDLIVAVNGKSTTGVTLEEFCKMMQVEAGIGVIFEIKQPEGGATHQYEIVRAEYEYSQMELPIPPNVIRSSQFPVSGNDQLKDGK